MRIAAMKVTTKVPSVSRRHSSCRILTLLPLAASILFAANPALTLQVSSETAPPGGYAQFKVSLTAPTLISSGSATMNFDPTIFGPAASVAAFSATGDQTGYATLNGTQLAAYFRSATAGIGQLPDLPVFVVTVPVLATAKIGATSSITVDPTKAPWVTGSTTYAVSVNPGTFSVGGALSIQNVTPGGGLLPSGTVVTINGTGLDPTTAVEIDGLSIASTQLVSAQQINVTLGGATEMTGKNVHLSNPAGAAVDYFASPTASVQVVAGGIKSGAWDVPVVPSAPSLFTVSADGVGQGAIVNQDGSVNNETNPAARGTAMAACRKPRRALRFRSPSRLAECRRKFSTRATGRARLKESSKSTRLFRRVWRRAQRCRCS